LESLALPLAQAHGLQEETAPTLVGWLFGWLVACVASFLPLFVASDYRLCYLRVNTGYQFRSALLFVCLFACGCLVCLFASFVCFCIELPGTNSWESLIVIQTHNVATTTALQQHHNNNNTDIRPSAPY
jgi:hypothetical protein